MRQVVSRNGSFLSRGFLPPLLAGLSLIQLAGCLVGADDALDDDALEDVEDTAGMTFEEFKAQAVKDPSTGFYIVDWDIPLRNDDELAEYYERHVRHGALLVRTSGGVDKIWSDAQKLSLTYCVSISSFGASYAQAVTAMNQAAAAWEASANVNFIHLSGHDASCTSSNNNVVFDVQAGPLPSNVTAQAFFPDWPRSQRFVKVDMSKITATQPLAAVMNHELGHVLGFVHEDDRLSSTTLCPDVPPSTSFRELTPLDLDSIMRCTSNVLLSAWDDTGVAHLYGLQYPSVGPWGGSAYSNTGGWLLSPSYWQTIQFPDLNNDNRADVCGRAPGGIYCGTSNGTNFTGHNHWTTQFKDADGWSGDPSYWQTIQFPDLNNDGRDDVCGRGSAGVYCALSNGASFGTVTLWAPAFSDANGWDADPSYWQTIRFPDLNHDGRADVCGRGPFGMTCGLSTGTTFATVTTWTAKFSDADGWDSDPSYWQTIQFPDINNDGRADVCGRGGAGIECGLSTGTTFGPVSNRTAKFSDADGWSGDPAYYETIRFPDVNGDGKADVCGRGGTGIFCGISNGTTFAAATQWSSKFSDADGWATIPAYWQTIQFADLNGDDKHDVCGRGQNGVYCAVSNASSFGKVELSTPSNFTDAGLWNLDLSRYLTIRFPDLNGDTQADVCARDTNGIICGRMF